MTDYDVFNGDADGICALVQLRLAEPRNTQLVTGVKRDINLLKQVDAQSGDRITVLDISMDKNRDDLQRVLAAGAEVFYVDHHFCGQVPPSAQLKSLINEAPDVCTSLLINRYLRGAYTAWGVVGTFGDNLKKSAIGLAKSLDITVDQLLLLEKLGFYVNYNGYGASVDDLFFNPADLYQKLVSFDSPFDFLEQDRDTFNILHEGYRLDMEKAENSSVIHSTKDTTVIELPDEKWARRVSGVFGNELANRNPDTAHAILTHKSDGSYLVSIRAPLKNTTGADTLARHFPTGGGRKAAAGINSLPREMLGSFIDKFEQQYLN